LILLVRYRKPRVALAAFAPALLASLFTVAVLALMGHELHLLHLVGILLVLSMGVDYGVFLAETVRQGHGESATLLGLVIACASTVLAFGLLGLSANPAMQAVGLTTGIGVLVSLVLAPTTLVLTGSRPRDKGEA
jgi:predicted exporter